MTGDYRVCKGKQSLWAKTQQLDCKEELEELHDSPIL